MQDNKNNQPNFRGIIIFVIILSLIIGAASGIIFGVWATSNEDVSNWVKTNILSQKVSKSTVQNVNSSLNEITQKGTIQITEDSATVSAVEKINPSVVSIVITQDLSKIYSQTGPNYPYGDFFDFPFQFQTPQGKQEVGAGTGFIITSDGLILTNKHVVSTDNAEYTVVMNDGEKYDAKVIDTDPFNDIALVKIEAKDLIPVELGDSDTLKLGQRVIAIGNALGQYQNTVTEGVISGLARTITAGDSTGQSETLENIIQTDAAINFGNSGGPLINLAGQVIGVNTAMSSQGELIGFAIPINQVKQAIESVQKNGKIVRPYLGVRYVIINKDIADKNKLSVDYGALIVSGSTSSELAVVPGSPADKAGLVENDIILEFNGQKIDQDHSLAGQIQKYNVGDIITLKILHTGTEKEVKVTLEEMKS